MVYPAHLPGLLVDLQEDPHELDNLWDDPQHREARADLVQELLRETIRTDRMNLPREAGA
jgi:uncharacterized sulfatase